jgi:hypothetical protein
VIFFRKEGLASGDLGDRLHLILDLLALRLEQAEEAATAAQVLVEETDDEHLGVAFPDLLYDLFVTVKGVFILTVGEQENDLFRLVSLPSFFDGKVEGVVERRPALDHDVGDGVADVLDVVGEVFDQLDLMVETDEEKLVLGMAQGEKEIDRLLHQAHLVPHTAAGVEDDTDGRGDLGLHEAGDLLFDSVLEDGEVLLGQTGD